MVEKLYPATKFLRRPTTRTGKKTLRLCECVPALCTQTLVFVHHRIYGVVLNRKSWVVRRRVHAHVVTLHVTV